MCCQLEQDSESASEPEKKLACSILANEELFLAFLSLSGEILISPVEISDSCAFMIRLIKGYACRLLYVVVIGSTLRIDLSAKSYLR